MKTEEFNFVVNDKGNFVFQGNSIRKLLSKNKGKRGVASIIFFDERDPKQIIGFYRLYMVPKIMKALYDLDHTYYTKGEVETKLWNMSAVTKGREENIYGLSVIEIHMFIEEIKLLAARDFGVCVD